MYASVCVFVCFVSSFFLFVSSSTLFLLTKGSSLGKVGGRSRSKSPFRSFRWKKSKSSTLDPIPGGSASDDESNIQKVKGIVQS